MFLKTLKRGPDRNFTYLFGSAAAGPLAVVDPGADARPVLDAAGDRTIAWIFVTHAHGDHIEGVAPLRKATGAKVAAHAAAAAPLARLGIRIDETLDDWEVIDVGGVAVRVLHTPGHEPASVCLLASGKALFTGDTLFVGNCGRTDLPGGDARALFRSLGRLKELDDAVVVLPGHDYGRTPQSTIGREKLENPTLRAETFEEFDALP